MQSSFLARALAVALTALWLFLLGSHFLAEKRRGGPADLLRCQVLLEKYELLARGLERNAPAPALAEALRLAPLSFADEAAALCPGEPTLLLERAMIKVRCGDPEGAAADLAAADRLGEGELSRILGALFLERSGGAVSEEWAQSLDESRLALSFRELALIRLDERLGRSRDAQVRTSALASREDVLLRSALFAGLAMAALCVLGVFLLLGYGAWYLRRRPPSPPPVERLPLLPVWIVFLAWEFIESAVFLMILRVTGLNSVRNPAALLAMKTISTGLCLGLLFGLLLPSAGVRGRDLGFPLDRTFLRRLAAGVGGFLVAVPAVLGLSLLSQHLFKTPGISSSPVFDLLLSGVSTAQALQIGAAVCLVGPAFEEVLFRGFLYSAFKARWGTWTALLLNAALFAAIHGEAAILIPLFALGFLLAWLYERSGSIWPSIVCHVLWNSTTIAFTLLVLGR